MVLVGISLGARVAMLALILPLTEVALLVSAREVRAINMR